MTQRGKKSIKLTYCSCTQVKLKVSQRDVQKSEQQQQQQQHVNISKYTAKKHLQSEVLEHAEQVKFGLVIIVLLLCIQHIILTQHWKKPCLPEAWEDALGTTEASEDPPFTLLVCGRSSTAPT